MGTAPATLQLPLTPLRKAQAPPHRESEGPDPPHLPCGAFHSLHLGVPLARLAQAESPVSVNKTPAHPMSGAHFKVRVTVGLSKRVHSPCH